MKNFIIICCVISFAQLSFSQCASAGEDSFVTRCKQELFSLNPFLSDSAATTGIWFNPQGNPTSGLDSIQFNIPGQYNFFYIVQDSICGSDTAKIILNIIVCFFGIEETNASNLTIFPNPTSNGVFTISKEVDYVIEDATGQRIPFIQSPGLFFIVVGETRYKLINL